MAVRALVWLDRLDRLACDKSRARVYVGEIVSAAGEGGTAAAILFFALPNALPSLPGVSTVLGAPLLLFTAQMFLGRSVWLPQWLASLSVARLHLRTMVRRLDRLLAWSRGISQPRLHALAGPLAMRLAGGLGCVLAILLMLPLPLVNIPIGVTLSLVAFGSLRGDGLAVLLGFACGIASIALTGGVLWGAWTML